MWKEIEIEYSTNMWTIHVNNSLHSACDSSMNDDRISKRGEREEKRREEHNKATRLNTQITFYFY